MGVGPMERAAAAALDARQEQFDVGNLEGVEMVEIDVVSAFRRLMREGSPLLRQGLATAIIENAALN